MQDAWLAFARTGDPNHDGIPAWPAWTSDSRPVLRFDVERGVEHDPHGLERAVWDGVL
jgi:para-nitrobenzyl esterase